MFRYRKLSLYRSTDPDERRAGLTINELGKTIDEVFEFGEEGTRDFFIQLYWNNVIDKIRSPEGAFKHPWFFLNSNPIIQ